MKKVFYVLMALVMVMASVAGCAAPAAEEPVEAPTEEVEAVEEAPADDVKTIAYIGYGLTNEMSVWMFSEMTKQIENYPNMELKLFDGNLDPETQVQQMENAIGMGVDFIMITTVDQQAVLPACDAAREAGIGVMVVGNSAVDETPAVDIDAKLMGVQPAEYAMSLMQEGQVGLLLGTVGNAHSDARHAGYLEVLANYPGIEIVDTQYANWMTDEAMRITEDWLIKFPEMKAVFAMCDTMAMGAYEAAKAAGREDTMIFTGADGLLDACNAVKAGTMNATVLQNAQDYVKVALEYVDGWFKGEEIPAYTALEPILITPDNVDEVISVHESVKDTEINF